MIESAIAFLVTHYATEDEPEHEPYCRTCGHVACECLNEGQDEESNQC